MHKRTNQNSEKKPSKREFNANKRKKDQQQVNEIQRELSSARTIDLISLLNCKIHAIPEQRDRTHAHFHIQCI